MSGRDRPFPPSPGGSAAVPKISRMEESSQADQRHVDGGKVAGEPPGQVDVGDGTVLSAQALGNLGERTAKAVPSEDPTLRRNHSGSDACATVRSPGEPSVEDVHH